LGKILDPFADKLMQCTVLICLWVGDYIPWWFVIPYFAKELFTLGIGLVVIKRRSVAVVSKWYGKMTVCLFYLTIAAAIVFQDFFLAHKLIGVILLLPVIICTFLSLGAYIKHYGWLKNAEVKKGDISDMLNLRREK
jgi:cardiolipin synthase